VKSNREESKNISKAKLKGGGFTLHFGPTGQLKSSPVTVWIGCTTSPAVWCPSAYCSALKIKLVQSLVLQNSKWLQMTLVRIT